jgi:antagonist of KipI
MFVNRAGLSDTIQDSGRTGFFKYAVPRSGFMDAQSAKRANTILGNDPNDAVLEMSIQGGIYRFDSPTFVCVSGAPMKFTLNGIDVESNCVIPVQPEDEIEFSQASEGVYTYLAVKGGFKSSIYMGSRSMHPSLFDVSRLKEGDVIEYTPTDGIPENKFDNTGDISLSSKIVVYPGPEFTCLKTPEQLVDLSLKVASHNRMGIRALPSTYLHRKHSTIKSAVVFPGIVQLTPSGELIVLHRDCQVTGGYPRVLLTDEKGLNQIAQIRQGSTIQFELAELSNYLGE